MYTQLNNEGIPSLDLMHNNEKVMFAYRSMEEIYRMKENTIDIPHRHNYYTVLWAKNVCGQHIVDYKEHDITPNILFFVNPGQVHQVITFGQPEGHVFMFTPDFLNTNNIDCNFITNLGLFSEQAGTPPIQLQNASFETLTETAEKLADTFNKDTKFKSEILGSYLKLFLIECNKLLPEYPNNSNHEIHAGKQLIQNFKKEVELNFSEHHKVAFYAGLLKVSADYLNNVIKSGIGKTAKEFIQNRITLEAKRLGVHTQLSNKEIAYQLGFDDPSHFSKFFKNIEKQAFSDFRNELSEKLLVNQAI